MVSKIKDTLKKILREYGVYIERCPPSYGIYVERCPSAVARDPEEIIKIDFDFVMRDFVMNRGGPDGVVFLQVGANDGCHGPLSHYISNHHWRGLLVEPQDYYFQKLEAVYSSEEEISLLNAAVSHESGQKTLYSVADPEADDMPSWAGGIASFHRDTLLSHAGQIPNLEERINSTPVDTYHLMELVKKEGLSDLDLLQIDVEGFDAEVVKMVDFDIVQPSIIQFEHEHLSNSDHNSAVDYLVSNGFKVARSGIDTVAYRR